MGPKSSQRQTAKSYEAMDPSCKWNSVLSQRKILLPSPVLYWDSCSERLWDFILDISKLKWARSSPSWSSFVTPFSELRIVVNDFSRSPFKYFFPVILLYWWIYLENCIELIPHQWDIAESSIKHRALAGKNRSPWVLQPYPFILPAVIVKWCEEGINTLRNEVMGDGRDIGDWFNFPGTGDHFQFFGKNVQQIYIHILLANLLLPLS